MSFLWPLPQVWAQLDAHTGGSFTGGDHGVLPCLGPALAASGPYSRVPHFSLRFEAPGMGGRHQPSQAVRGRTEGRPLLAF